MDFTNVKDPAGINALLDSLRSSSVFTNELSSSKNDQQPAETFGREELLQAPPDSLESSTAATEPSSTISSQVSSLLSLLESTSSRPNRSFSRSDTNSVAGPSKSSRSSSLVTSNVQPPQNSRTMTFQQALPHIGRLLENPDITASLRKMKIEQNELEQRLWMGREGIVAAQQKRVNDALAVTQLTHATVPQKERENMAIEFDRELERYDRHRVLPAWDNLLKQQQEKLEALGFPTFFPSTSPADRARQQRVVDVLASAIDPEFV